MGKNKNTTKQRVIAGADYSASTEGYSAIVCISNNEINSLWISREASPHDFLHKLETMNAQSIWLSHSFGGALVEDAQMRGIPVRTFRLTKSSKDAILIAAITAVRDDKIANLCDYPKIGDAIDRLDYDLIKGWRLSMNGDNQYTSIAIAFAIAWYQRGGGFIRVDFA